MDHNRSLSSIPHLLFKPTSNKNSETLLWNQIFRTFVARNIIYWKSNQVFENLNRNSSMSMLVSISYS